MNFGVFVRTFRVVYRSGLSFKRVIPSSKTVSRDFCSVSRSGFNDYDKERSSWNVSIPEHFNFVHDIIDTWALKEQCGERSAEIPAFWFVSTTGEEVRWSFQRLSSETKKASNVLEQRCGVKRGENVIVMLPKTPEFWLVNLAAIRVGAVLCPAGMMLTTKDLSYRFSTFPPVCIIAHESAADAIDAASGACPSLRTKVLVSKNNKRRNGWLNFGQLLEDASSDHKCADTRSDESMMVFFTSGTTGQPKLAEHTHSSYGIGHMATGKYFLDLTKDNISWNLSDTGWAKTAYSSIFAPWYCGACVFVHEMPRFSPTLVLQTLSTYPIDTFCGPPMAYRAMVRENLKEYKFKCLSHTVSGGEALNPKVIESWKAGTGLHLQEGYGQTETILAISMYKCLEYRPGCLGKPNPALDIVIVDENENELAPEVAGEIAIKKRDGKIFGLFKGYKDDPDRTKLALTDEYYHTGDLGYRDEDGYFWFVGRNDDLINSAGYRIGPFEVESALMEHPAVAEVAVTSSPDSERGEVVKAFVVLKDEYLSAASEKLVTELKEHVKRTTAPYKYPRKIEFLTELPKTASGKIKRYELKNMEWKNTQQ